MEFKCPHCGNDFVKDEKTQSVKCKGCGCVFRLILVHYDTKCYGKMFKEEIKELVKEGKKEKKHGKRGRKPKKIFIEGPEGEKIDVSVDNPKLKKLAETSVLSTTPFDIVPIKRKRGRPRKVEANTA